MQRGLIASLLHLDQGDIRSVEIKNPIKLGEQIELATDEDRLCGLDHWARLFKAKTWEDLRMVVEQNQYLSAAAEEMYVRNADETIRANCQAREDYYRRQRRIQKQLEDQKNEIVEKEQVIAEKEQTIVAQQQMLSEKEQELQVALKHIAELEGTRSNR